MLSAVVMITFAFSVINFLIVCNFIVKVHDYREKMFTLYIFLIKNCPILDKVYKDYVQETKK